MAAFDNGLPPASTDMTGKCVSNVSIRMDDTQGADIQAVQAVKVLTEETTIQGSQKVQAVSLATKEVGKNRVMYM